MENKENKLNCVPEEDYLEKIRENLKLKEQIEELKNDIEKLKQENICIEKDKEYAKREMERAFASVIRVDMSQVGNELQFQIKLPSHLNTFDAEIGFMEHIRNTFKAELTRKRYIG